MSTDRHKVNEIGEERE